MKNLTLLLTIFLSLIFSNTKAQDDANCKLLVDGTLTDRVDCWSFSDLSVVFPMNDVKKFDLYKIKLSFGVPMVNTFSSESFWNTFGAGTLGCINVYKEKLDKSNFTDFFNIDWGKSHLVYADQKDVKEFGIDLKLNFKLLGYMIVGYKETYNGNSIIKTPVYGEDVVIYNKTFRFPDQIAVKFGIVSGEPKGGYPPIDYSKTCPIVGEKVDYKIEFVKSEYSPSTGIIRNVGTSSASMKNKISEKTSNAVTPKTETKTNTTTEKANTTSAVSSSALKPLDKKKPGYFADKSGNEITREGYKKGDALNGEVRVYDEGKIREIHFYVNDKKHGSSTYYFDNGQIEMTGNMKDDEKDGEWKFYNDNGKLRETKKYLNGENQD